MEKGITISGRVYRKIRDLRELKLHDEAVIELEDEEGKRRQFIAKKTDEKVLDDGTKIERHILTPIK